MSKSVYGITDEEFEKVVSDIEKTLGRELTEMERKELRKTAE